MRDGGVYAGALGVVSALAAVDELRERGFTPERPLGVVNFVESAGARFGVACLGSRVVTGEYDAARALALRDADGVSLAEAMRATGHDADLVGPDEETMRRVGTFVELRLEPGPRLAELGAPVGVGAGTRTRAGGGPDADGSPFDDALVAGIAEALGAPVLDTPAEYDAGVLARAGVDVAMLFVRNPTGVSQAPDETADWRDCLSGVAALTDVVERLVHTGER
ncbi:M20/M25/M40 family metallo-hydrolase [Agilicoccus flavus]|uniref:M20/M25/M40 family metallo-hydrolase n=1 Tax=Agilicoccus flavus TaxID=2775968 RepID=UPI0027DA386D|nr:M20/M25/M40 family metallo-hydrolase [Agilicoccus flavus]